MNVKITKGGVTVEISGLEKAEAMALIREELGPVDTSLGYPPPIPSGPVKPFRELTQEEIERRITHQFHPGGCIRLC